MHEAREIKFRGLWNNGDAKKWVYGGIEIRHDGEVLIGGNGVWYVVDPKTVGQFIGLLDKNKKEIYEGDIVQIEDGKYYGEVMYFSASFGMKLKEWKITLSPRKDYRIIGNIYENPSLIHP